VIIRSQGPHSALRAALGRDLKGRVSPAVYAVGCVAALFGTGTGPYRPGIWISIGCYVAVAALWIIPDRRIESVVGQPGAGPGPDEADEALDADESDETRPA
jgi:hypothetical protein